MNPIETIENELRNLIDDILSDKFGISWTEDTKIGLGGDWSNKLTEKAKNDVSVRGNIAVYGTPLLYSEFSDLKNLIEKHKALFQCVFKKWERTIEFLGAAEDFRNSLAHNREISPTQQSLLRGIAGEIADDIALWRIGTDTNEKEIVFEFRDYIPTDNTSDEEIILRSKEMVEDLSVRFVDTLKLCKVKEQTIIKESSDFVSKIKAPHITIDIETSSRAGANSRIDGLNYKYCISLLRYKSACRIDIDDFLKHLDKQYLSIEYALGNNIDVASLKKWSLEKAGLNPGSSSSSNGQCSSVDYGFLNGKLRISVIRDGSVRLTCEKPEGCWFPHRTIKARHLFGFMLGNITPRAMMYLHQRSLFPEDPSQLS